jgi:uncharacterized protein YjbI with pentapeptide repeats
LVIPPLELSENQFWRGWQTFLAEDIYQDKKHPTIISRNLVVVQENLTKITDPHQLSQVLDSYAGYFDPKSDKYLKTRELVATKRLQNRFYGIDLKDRDLRYANFSESVLINANIERSNLNYSNLSATVMTLAIGGCYNEISNNAREKCEKVTTFNNSNLWKANLNGSDLEQAQFNRSDLRLTKFNDSDLEEVEFNDSVLLAIKVKQSKKPLYPDKNPLGRINNSLLLYQAGSQHFNISEIKITNTVIGICDDAYCLNIASIQALYDHNGNIIAKPTKQHWLNHAKILVAESLCTKQKQRPIIESWLKIYRFAQAEQATKLILSKFDDQQCESLYNHASKAILKERYAQ